MRVLLVLLVLLVMLVLLALLVLLQVMLTEVPVPGASRLRQAALTYQQQHASCYYADLLRAHAYVGLLRQISILAQPSATAAAAAAAVAGASAGLQQQLDRKQQRHVAWPWAQSPWAFASLASIKHMEVVVVGQQRAPHFFRRCMLH